MWVFYLISLPLTVGMVTMTLRYFAGPEVRRYVLWTVGYTWFCSLSIIILVPADMWTSIHLQWSRRVISFFWSWSYWSTFLLTWTVVPLLQGFEDAGDFTVADRLKSSIHVNLIFYLLIGALAFLGLILVLLTSQSHSLSHGVLGFAMACSNTFGLVTGAFLLGFGLSQIPKSIWNNSHSPSRHKLLSHYIAKSAVNLDNAHHHLSNAIVVAQATSTQMSKRDPLRPCMDVIDNMLALLFRQDPSFKPQGGRLGENDMDYDTDHKSMATLRRHLRGAREDYYRYKSEYLTYVMEALELEDTIRNYERRDATGWKYVSSFRPTRTGKLGSYIDSIEFLWRCILREQVHKLLAIILGIMSAAILLAEATLLPNLDLSLFSILINAVKGEEVLVQVFAFIPLMYMCVCTYYSLFKIGRLMFYSLTPRQSSSVNLLMICSMVARYAPPISYNFLNLIRLRSHGKEIKTIFEELMGSIDTAVPFFGKEFNRIYPLIMVVYTLLVASNFFDRVINYFGRWKIFRFQTEVEDMDGFDASGLIILQKERSWLEQGSNVGEHVIPLARNFNNADVESGSNGTDRTAVEMKASSSVTVASKAEVKDETRKYGSHREAMSSKYAAIREQAKTNTNTNTKRPPEQSITSAQVSLLTETTNSSSTSLSSKWASMKSGFQSFKANIGAKKFLPLRQLPETKLVSRVSSSESLDEIFQRLKRPSVDHESCSDAEDEHAGWKPKTLPPPHHDRPTESM